MLFFSTHDSPQVLSRFDADHSGDLSFEEYLALMAVWVEEDETQIIEAFKVTIKLFIYAVVLPLNLIVEPWFP